jgi:hypothetical protein
MTTLLQSEPSAKSVKLVTGWGWVENLTSKGLIITVKTGFLKGKDYKENDIDFIIEVGRDSKAKSAAISGGIIAGLLLGPAGAMGGAIGGALSGAGSETYAVRFKDGQEIVIQEERANNREALKRLSRATAGLAILASNRKSSES